MRADEDASLDTRDRKDRGFTPELLTVVGVGFDDNQPVSLTGTPDVTGDGEAGDNDMFGVQQTDQLLRLEQDERAGLYLVATPHLLLLDSLAAVRIHHPLLHRLVIGVVQRTEVNSAVLDRGIQLHGDFHSSELHDAFPDRARCHAAPMASAVPGWW